MSALVQSGNDSEDPEERFGWQLRFLLAWVGVLWLIEFVDFVTGHRIQLDLLGIRPRTVSGLVGIFLAPMLHGGFGHLAANTLPLVALGWLSLNTGVLQFWVATLLATVVGGLGVWLIGGGNTIHIGASVLIFGYLGFLLAYGIFRQSVKWILVSVGVGIIYGGMIFSVLPGEQSVSWQGHLFGLVGGVLAAWLLRNRGLERSPALD